MDNARNIMRFDAFELDLAERQLRRGGVPVELGSRYFDALALLVRDPGALVTKDRFMDEVWRGIPVTDEALTQCIRTLRRALDDDASAPRFIQTVPKHGYRFVAAMAGPRDESAPAPASAWPLPGRVAGASTIAGAASGALGGFIYGIVAGTGGPPGVLALAALVAALGTLGGAGVGLGMAAILAWRRHADAVLPAGAAAGGMAIGALGGTLGRDGIGLLTGASIGPVTGLTEGLVLGLVTGMAGLIALGGGGRAGRLPLALLAPILGACGGAAIHALGGKLLGGTLATLEQGLGTMRLSLDPIGAIMGEPGFGPAASLVTAMVEGAVFAAAVALGVRAANRRRI